MTKISCQTPAETRSTQAQLSADDVGSLHGAHSLQHLPKLEPFSKLCNLLCRSPGYCVLSVALNLSFKHCVTVATLWAPCMTVVARNVAQMFVHRRNKCFSGGMGLLLPQ